MNVTITIPKCFFVLPDCHNPTAESAKFRRGYPTKTRRKCVVCRTVYVPSDKQDFDSDHFVATLTGSTEAKIAAV